MNAKVVRGHSINLRVSTADRSIKDTVADALEALSRANVPDGTPWVMTYHIGKRVSNGESFNETDYITIEAAWTERGANNALGHE